jgi:hypothetical protein
MRASLRRAGAIAAIVLASTGTLAAAEYAPATYDLSALQSYRPQQVALGVLRISGTPLEALVGRWATEFRAKQGHVRLNASHWRTFAIAPTRCTPTCSSS